MCAEFIKIIAIIAMTFDHVAYHLLPFGELYELFRGFGRIALPLFCFLISEGFIHTRSRIKYLLRLSIYAAILEVGLLILYLITGENYLFSVNIFLSLSTGLLSLMLLKSKRIWIKLLAIPLIFAVSLTKFDYGVYAIALILLFGFFTRTEFRLIGFVIINLFFIEIFSLIPNANSALCFGSSQWYSLLSLPIIFLYNGKPGKSRKWFFYLYYPIHLGIIIGIGMLLNII